MDKRPLLIGLLWDVGLPAVVFYAGRSFGLGVIWALTAGAVAALVRVGCVAAVRHRLDGLAALVGTSFVLLLAASLLTGDPRILLARESILSGAAGLLLVGSCVIHRPVLHTVVRRAVADNDALLAQWDQRWRTQPSFRRHIVLMSTVLGGVLLTESTVRLALIYLLPIDAVAGWSTALHLGTVVLLVCWALWYRDRRRRAMAADRLRTQAEPQRLRGQ
ncbi:MULTISPECIES: VC0807 family protein [Streptomyces]|uniref:VC0807 family protein n=1 Tax=Streptomyces TaxID=1883 RepID=UPI002E2681C9|nr:MULTISPECIES: VC0807 family protein [unclassified Streptomyces]